MSQSHQKTSKSWELTPYEIQRKPQEVIMDGREIQISPRSLHSELMCPICLDMLRQTQTTKECLHRFCSDCITTALRSGNKECPTCRKKLVSRRSLRSDPNFDALIRKIYPNREEFDTMTQNAFEKISMISNPGALSQSIEEGLKSQAKNRNQKMKKSDVRDATRSNPPPPTTITNVASSSANHNTNNQQSTSQQEQNHESKAQDTKGQTANLNSAQSDEKARSNGVSEKHGSGKTSSKDEQDNNHDDDDDDKEVTCGSSSKQSPSEGEGTVKIDVELRPHPEQTGTKADVLVRKINVVEIATMHHVSHYLTLRIMMEKSSSLNQCATTGGAGGDAGGKSIDQNNPPEFTLFIKQHDNYHELSYDEKLTEVRDQRWKKKDQRVHIYYLRKPKKQ